MYINDSTCTSVPPLQNYQSLVNSPFCKFAVLNMSAVHVVHSLDHIVIKTSQSVTRRRFVVKEHGTMNQVVLNDKLSTLP